LRIQRTAHTGCAAANDAHVERSFANSQTCAASASHCCFVTYTAAYSVRSKVKSHPPNTRAVYPAGGLSTFCRNVEQYICYRDQNQLKILLIPIT